MKAKIYKAVDGKWYLRYYNKKNQFAWVCALTFEEICMRAKYCLAK